jgi:flavin-dependent dehydrogenase
VWVGKFDGKDYAVTGDPTADTRALKQIDAHTLALTSKKGGKVTLTGKIVVAADGMSRTLTASATDSMGMKVEGMSFYLESGVKPCPSGLGYKPCFA